MNYLEIPINDADITEMFKQADVDIQGSLTLRDFTKLMNSL